MCGTFRRAGSALGLRSSSLTGVRIAPPSNHNWRKIVTALASHIQESKITQSRAARIMGVAQPRISNLVRGGSEEQARRMIRQCAPMGPRGHVTRIASTPTTNFASTARTRRKYPARGASAKSTESTAAR
ncbi:MAG: hypothetical protein EXQ52_07655 [Bryobacterales bacterium]|nr:hypothetical protein [Bryobacterales bacterium]